jgi:hypothetical protein
MFAVRYNYQNELTREERVADYLALARGHFSFSKMERAESFIRTLRPVTTWCVTP